MKRPFLARNGFLSFFTRKTNDETPTALSIYKAAKSGNDQKLQELLTISTELPNREILLNTEDLKGKTALTVAVLNGHLSCVELLLSFGADVHHMNWNQNGGTALHEAISAYVPQNVIRLLLRFGADPFIENLSRTTAFDLALKRQDASLIRLFEKFGKFCQYILIKSVKEGGMGVTWERKWISLIPRYACTRSFKNKHWIGDRLFVFEDASYEHPICIWNVKDASAEIEVDEDLNAEVAIINLSQQTSPSFNNYLILDKGRHLLTLNGQLKDLNFLARAISEETAPIGASGQLSDGVIESDAALARRLQREFDSENHSVVAKSSVEDNGAGPSNTGSGSSSTIPQDHSFHNRQKMKNEGIVFESEEPGKGKCVVCKEDPKIAGSTQGTSVHLCVCEKCAKHIWTGKEHGLPVHETVDNIITTVRIN